MLEVIVNKIRRNPVIVSQVVALAGAVLNEVLAVVESDGGTLAVWAALVLSAAGYGRSKVTPV